MNERLVCIADEIAVACIADSCRFQEPVYNLDTNHVYKHRRKEGAYVLTSKQRAKLKGMANGLDTIGQVGKGGIVDTLVKQTDDALAARELIKMRVLDNAPVSAREAAEELAHRVGAQVVQVIGSRFVLFRPDPENTRIEL